MVLGLIALAVIIAVTVFYTLPDTPKNYFHLEMHPRPPGGEDLPLIYIDRQGLWKQWKPELDSFMEDYYSNAGFDGDRLYACSSHTDVNSLPDDISCFFDVRVLQSLDESVDYYGYERNQPSVFISPSQTVGFIPDFYRNMSEVPDTAPEGLKKMMRESERDGKLPLKLWIWCDGKHPVDREYIGTLEYYPRPPGFEFYYFPYKDGQAGLSPLVGVSFRNLKPGSLVTVVCTPWAKNTQEERASITWEIMIE